MNILPLICGLLIVFSVISATFLSSKRSLSIIEWSLTASARTERELRNAIETRRFRKVSKKPAPQATPIHNAAPTEKQNSAFIDYRSRQPADDLSKLNIAPLFETRNEVQKDPLYPIALNLIETLYAEKLFKKKKLSQQVLDGMIVKGKLLKKVERLSDLFPDDPELKSLYYKMLKGTNQYSVEQGLGIPALSDFFHFGKGEKGSAIHFHFASFPLLSAVFGKEAASKIIALEKKQWEQTGKLFSMDQNALSPLMLQHASSCPVSMTDLGAYLSFDKQIPVKKDLSAVDKQSGLVIRRKC